MSKKKKYIIESCLGDSMITKLEVTEKQFQAALQSTQLQFENQGGQPGDDFYISHKSDSYDYEGFTEKIEKFEWSISSIWFRFLECKPGVEFKR